MDAVQMSENNWRNHFSATRDLLKMMAKEREISESRRQDMSSDMSSATSSGYSMHSSQDTSTCQPPPAPSQSPASDYYSSYGSLGKVQGSTRSGATEPGSRSSSHPDLGSRDRYMESPSHYMMNSSSKLSYDSEGESFPSQSEESLVHQHYPVSRVQHEYSTWGETTNEAYQQDTYHELSAIPLEHHSRSNDLTEYSTSMAGPLHSTLLNLTQGNMTTASSLYLEDVHSRSKVARSRMAPIGEEGEFSRSKDSKSSRHRHRCHKHHKEHSGSRHHLHHHHHHPQHNHHHGNRHHDHHHHYQNMACALGHYQNNQEVLNPSVLAYSMNVQQGSAPNSPMPRPDPPSPRKQVTFNHKAHVEHFQKDSFESSTEDSKASLKGTKSSTSKSKKDKTKAKKSKKSIKFFKCCTSANKTYASLPERDLPDDDPKEEEDNYNHIYDTINESRPPCVGKEATPTSQPGHARSSHYYSTTSCCGGQECHGAMPPQEPIYGQRVNYTLDSDATAFMESRMVRRGVAANSSMRDRDAWTSMSNLGAEFKTLALF